MRDGRPLSAVVLAGGRSSRFGRDKLAEPIEGRSLLDRAVDAVRPLATEVLVVAAPGSALAIREGARIVNDLEPFEGPLAGTLAGLTVATGESVLVVGGDMPSLVAAVLESMARELDDPAIDACVLVHDRRVRPLPIVVRRTPAIAAARTLLDGGERRLRALLDALETRSIPEEAWRRHDPDADTLRDIDTPADLE
jgi:molybdopterin-guanine dinucleotide biosynthesis protein A